MRKCLLAWLLLVLFSLLCANNYAPQSLIFSTINKIEVKYPHETWVETDCDWFNKLAHDYSIDNILFLAEFMVEQDKEYCYLIGYLDSISVDSLTAIFNEQGKVDYAEPDFYATPHSDTYLGNQWSLNKIQMLDVWNDEQLVHNGYGSNIKVGIVDSGIDLGTNPATPLPIHPDLEANLYNDGQNHYGYNALAYIQHQNLNILNVQDQFGHGTHVAGIVGARYDNNEGIAGIAGGNSDTEEHGCQIYSIKVGGTFSFSKYYLSAIISGIYYAYMTEDVRIFNCSFGFENSNDGLNMNALMNHFSSPWLEEPALFICSAGNNGQNSGFYPSANDRAISVAATDINDKKTIYSNYHSTVDICAPGGTGEIGTNTGIISTLPQDNMFYLHTPHTNVNPVGADSEYDLASGTSMSAPMVTGAVVLVKQAFHQLSLQEVKSRILGTADNISEANPDFDLIGRLGAGRLNVYRALTEEPHANLRLNAVQVINSYGMEGNAVVCGDPSAQINMQLKNWWVSSQGGVTGTLSTEDPDVTITNSSADWNVIGENFASYSNDMTTFADNSTVPRDILFKLTIEYDNRSEEFFFKVHRQINYNIFKISIPDRTPTSELIIDDMNNDGTEEIALTTRNGNNFYVNLLFNGSVLEYQLDGLSPVKPAFADVNYDGKKELVVIDNSGDLSIFDYQLSLLHSANVSPSYEIASFAIEDVSDDGLLDTVMLLKYTFNNITSWSVKALIMQEDYSYEARSYYFPTGYTVLSKNMAIGNVDASVYNEMLFVTKHIVDGRIKVDVTKLYYSNNKAPILASASGNIGDLSEEDTYYLEVTDMILSKPHPDDVMDKKTYIYYGMGHKVNAHTIHRVGLGNFFLYCIDFWNAQPEVEWDYDYNNDNIYAENNVDQDVLGSSGIQAFNIIAGDFVSSNPGIEIVTAASDGIMDSETGAFIDFTFENTQGSGSSMHHSLLFNQPAVIVDYDDDNQKELFLYKNHQIRSVDENQNEDMQYNCTLPDSIMSCVSGRGRFSNMYDVYALGSEANVTNIYYLPIKNSYQETLYEWRQFNNNSRKTCEFYQPIPSELNYELFVWNNSIIDIDLVIDGSLNLDKGVTIRMNKDVLIRNSGHLKFNGEDDNTMITLSGLCKRDVLDYWQGITSLNNSMVDCNHVIMRNAENGFYLFDAGDYALIHNSFSSNLSGISAYNSTLDLGHDEWLNNDYGITAFHASRANMGYSTGAFQGYNSLIENIVGMFSGESEFYLEEGY